jgi:hypothetical protein
MVISYREIAQKCDSKVSIKYSLSMSKQFQRSISICVNEPQSFDLLGHLCFNRSLIVTFSQATVQLSKQVNNPRQRNADAGQQQPGEC